jgi:hypothetical protein
MNFVIILLLSDNMSSKPIILFWNKTGLPGARPVACQPGIKTGGKDR